MERRITRRARRVRDLLTANADGKALEKVIHKLEQKELALVERIEDLEEELSTLREENYIGIPAPRSLTEEMELESRLSL